MPNSSVASSCSSRHQQQRQQPLYLIPRHRTQPHTLEHACLGLQAASLPHYVVLSRIVKQWCMAQCFFLDGTSAVPVFWRMPSTNVCACAAQALECGRNPPSRRPRSPAQCNPQAARKLCHGPRFYNNGAQKRGMWILVSQEAIVFTAFSGREEVGVWWCRPKVIRKTIRSQLRYLVC